MKKAREFYLLSKDGKTGHWAYDTEEKAIHSGGKTASESFGVTAYIEKSAYDSLMVEAVKLRGVLEHVEGFHVDHLSEPERQVFWKTVDAITNFDKYLGEQDVTNL